MPPTVEQIKLHRYDDATLSADVGAPRRAGDRSRLSTRLESTLGPADVGRQSRRARAQNLALLFADAVGALLAVVLGAAATSVPLTLSGTFGAMAVVIVVGRVAGLNDKDSLVLRRSTLDEAPRILQIAALAAGAYWLTLAEGPGRAPLLWLVVLLTVSLLAARSFVRAVLKVLLPAERCLFVGDMGAAGDIRNKLEHGRANATLVGALGLRGSAGTEAFGGVEGLQRIVREERITRVILAPVTVSAADTMDLIRVAKEAGAQVSIFPRLFEVIGTAVEFEDLEGITLMGVRRFGLSPTSRALKRCFDFVGASLCMVAVAPLMAVIALAVRIDSRGPVFFKQTRVGRDGAQFGIMKFRSMVTDAEALKDSLRDKNETEGLFKITDDPRITRVGRFLRKTSLDELPQLLNVLKGEMSLVGPRPLVVDEDRQVLGLDRRRLHLTPGMTGPWQVMRSGRVPMHEMVAIDYLYVSTWSLWNDLKLLLRTASYVLSRGGV